MAPNTQPARRVLEMACGSGRFEQAHTACPGVRQDVPFKVESGRRTRKDVIDAGVSGSNTSVPHSGVIVYGR